MIASRYFVYLCAAVMLVRCAPAQTAAASQPAPAIADAWGQILPNATAEASEKSAAPASNSGAKDFLNHFYFNSKTEYTRSQYSFSGQPTATGVIDASATSTVNPAGFPYPSAFQPSVNTAYDLIDTGTHGFLSDRINTNLTLRYWQDLTHVEPGSPGLSMLDTFRGNRLFEFLNGYVEINGKDGDGFFSDSSVRLGRQTLYGAALVSFDGFSFTRNRSRYSLTLFAGRRFSYYSDPVQRAIGGLDFTFHLTANSQVEYHGLLYLKGTHFFAYHQKVHDTWLFNSAFRMVGTDPVDFTASVFWAPRDGRTTLGATFFQKLTDKDFFYDYLLNATDQDSHNQYPRLYLGPIAQYSQFSIDARRTFNSYLRLGGGVVVRRLNNDQDQGPFDVSLQDYRADAQVFPWRRFEVFLGFHEQDSDRKNPLPTAYFADVSAAGETKLQDFTLEIGRGFFENRVNLKGGGFLRRIDFQDAYNVITDAQDKGFAGNASFQVDTRTRVYFEYGLDTDFFVWRPSIKNGQLFRLGVNWKY